VVTTHIKFQYLCKVCGFICARRDYLEDHLRLHTGEASPTCEICGLRFNKLRMYKNHVKIHRNINSESASAYPFKCHICVSEFGTTDTIKSHLVDAHSDLIFNCSICKAVFRSSRARDNHMNSEHQVNNFREIRFWCPICSQGFSQNSKLTAHLKKRHDRELSKNSEEEEKKINPLLESQEKASLKFCIKLKHPFLIRRADHEAGAKRVRV